MEEGSEGVVEVAGRSDMKKVSDGSGDGQG